MGLNNFNQFQSEMQWNSTVFKYVHFDYIFFTVVSNDSLTILHILKMMFLLVYLDDYINRI